MAIIKQKQLAQKIVDERRKPSSEQKSFYKLAKEVGYGEHTAQHPKEFFSSDSWNDLLDEALPEDLILQRLAKNAFQSKSIGASNKALEIILKLKGKFAPQKFQIVDPLSEMSDDELSAEITRLEAKRQAPV
jgi:hypothetical protein